MASVNSDAQTWIRAYQISRTQNFRSEGHRCLPPRSHSGPCPREAAEAAQHDHAMIPAEEPPNGRPRGRYKHPVPDTNVRDNLRLQTWRKGLARRGAVTERLSVPRYNPV